MTCSMVVYHLSTFVIEVVKFVAGAGKQSINLVDIAFTLGSWSCQKVFIKREAMRELF